MTKSIEAIDFSQGSIRKAVRKKIVDSPLVAYPAVLGVLAGMSLFVFEPTALLIGAAAGLVAFGLGALGVNVAFRRPALEGMYVKKLHQLLEQKMGESIENLETDLGNLHLDHGIAQLQKLKEKLDNLIDIINRRFSEGELTQARYLGTAHQVYLSALDNLNEMVVAQQSISKIEVADIHARLAKLKKLASPSSDEHAQVASLEERKELFDSQRKKILALLTQNELAMTALDNTAVALANVKTSVGHTAMSADDAMKELAALAKRAGSYAAE